MAGISFSDIGKMFSTGQSDSQPMPSNPAAYGDWKTYAGNIPNPMNFGSFQNYSGMGQAIQPPTGPAPVAPTFSQMKERFGQVADQLGQGNILDAMKTYQYGVKPVAKSQNPEPKMQDTEDNVMSSSWGG